MAAPVLSHKLTSALEGALAGGGDPATSPLYVFTPFLKLIMLGAVAGVAKVTFGATIWLVVLTVITVSIMYRLVMRWVTDGSGGSGLAEEEFGGWAVKTNAAITYIEYTLTFLVSMAALVTFIADRAPALGTPIVGGITIRTLVAILLSILTGWLVNRGPKTAARFFGPATMGVLGLLWLMILSTLWQHLQGFMGGEGLLVGVPVLPTLDPQAFSLAETAPGEPAYLHFTLGGYARILALMTGIEVFANLVAAYDGDAMNKAKLAFRSLIIIMGTTALTMVIVGPAIFALADPANPEVSVFTQTMDQLLPGPVAYIGTLVGVAVLLSACAASAVGIQNLSLGLAARRYIPSRMGRTNRFGVADMPVWMEVGVCCLCFLLIGTSEETYLAIYAAGVFILLSMTGMAATRRLLRPAGIESGLQGRQRIFALLAAIISASLTAVATVIIFYERFFEGAWTFLVLIPVLYLGFSYVRGKAGDIDESMMAGDGDEVDAGASELAAGPEVAGVAADGAAVPGAKEGEMREIRVRKGDEIGPAPKAEPVALGGVRVDVGHMHAWPETPAAGEGWRGEAPALNHVLVTLDGSQTAETALPAARWLASPGDGRITLVSVLEGADVVPVDAGWPEEVAEERGRLEAIAARLNDSDDRISADLVLRQGPIVPTILDVAKKRGAEVVAIAAQGRSRIQTFLLGSVSRKLVQLADLPVLVVRAAREGEVRSAPERVLVALDGSAFAERVLPYARGLARDDGAELVLLVVPEIPESVTDVGTSAPMEELRRQDEAQAEHYLRRVLLALAEDGVKASGLVGGVGAARTIVDLAGTDGLDLVMMATHGRGGIDGLLLGSVASRVIRHSHVPVFLLPIHERVNGAKRRA